MKKNDSLLNRVFLLIILILLFSGCGGESDEQIATILISSIFGLYFLAFLFSMLYVYLFNKCFKLKIKYHLIAHIICALSFLIASTIVLSIYFKSLHIAGSPTESMLVIFFIGGITVLITKILLIIFRKIKLIDKHYLAPLFLCIFYLIIGIATLFSGKFPRGFTTNFIDLSFLCNFVVIIWIIADIILAIIQYYKK